jgi:hypothetical protein
MIKGAIQASQHVFITSSDHQGAPGNSSRVSREKQLLACKRQSVLAKQGV